MAALYPDCTFHLWSRQTVLSKWPSQPFKQYHGSAVFRSTFTPYKYFFTQSAVPQYDCKCCLPGVEFPLRNLRSTVPFGKRCSCYSTFPANLLVRPYQFHAGRHVGRNTYHRKILALYRYPVWLLRRSVLYLSGFQQIPETQPQRLTENPGKTNLQWFFRGFFL